MSFNEGRWIRVSDSRHGYVPLRHASVYLLIAVNLACTLADELFALRLRAAYGLAERMWLSVPLTFVSESWWALALSAWGAFVAGGVIVSRDGARTLWALVLVMVAVNMAINATMQVGIYGSGLVLLAYVVARWPGLRVSGFSTDFRAPLWLLLVLLSLYAVAVLAIEGSGGPAEGHHMVGSMLAVLVGGLLGLTRTLVHRRAREAQDRVGPRV